MKKIVLVLAALAALSGCAVSYDNGPYRSGNGDRDRDGIANRYDRDRDGDGVRNRNDARPNNPNRY
jgi:Prokaryotic membrane lipoprotein lipid attachment site